jgi:VWFA-related protein
MRKQQAAFFLSSAVALVITSISPALAQDLPGGIGITYRSEVASVLLEARVYDKQGRVVAKLDPARFVVRENGVRQTPDRIARQILPATIALLVDSSQSMSCRMDFVRLAAERLGGALRPDDKIIVVPFNKELGAVTGPTNDATTITGAVAAMHAHGGTAILDSVLDATRLLEGAEGRRAIVLITDGYDENSKGDLTTVLKTAEARQISIYVVAIGGVAGISLKGERVLRALADETVGRVFFPSRESEMHAVARAISADLFNRYVISYTPSNQNQDGSWREIAVEVPGDYVVRTRAGYFAR